MPPKPTLEVRSGSNTPRPEPKADGTTIQNIIAIASIIVVNGAWLAAYHLLDPMLSSLASSLPAVIYCNHVCASHMVRASPLPR